MTDERRVWRDEADVEQLDPDAPLGHRRTETKTALQQTGRDHFQCEQGTCEEWPGG